MSAVTPLLDFFRRGEVPREARLLAAQGILAPAASEQLAILILLQDDPDPEVRSTAETTMNRIPENALCAFLARPDVAIGMREFFADRGVFPAEVPDLTSEAPLIDTEPDLDPDLTTDAAPAEGAADEDAVRQGLASRIAKMTFPERLKLAVKGSREARSLLIRDPNKMIAVAVLSNPKLNDAEVESFARMTNVTEDVLRVIAMNRAWIKNYAVVVSLVRNPKTPVGMSLNLLGRLVDRDLSMISVDRNVPETLRAAARRKVAAAVNKR